MATVIRKLKIDVFALNSARKKLQGCGESELNEGEARAILKLIQKGKSTLFPRLHELETYQHAMDQLSEIDKNTHPAKFDHYAGQIEKFEQKYCK